jgi:hypothetical protein
MRKNIKLFIANKEVDCSEGISLPITYTVEDFQNPTIVKNSFSKTISIPGTKNNNKIFGEIYKLDRFLHIKEGNFSGVYFDPSKRVDFGIYNNGYLVESGYMQLNSISIKQAVITYNITLYGGLGDFFYGLKYKEDGTIRTLADLQYFLYFLHHISIFVLLLMFYKDDSYNLYFQISHLIHRIGINHCLQKHLHYRTTENQH